MVTACAQELSWWLNHTTSITQQNTRVTGSDKSQLRAPPAWWNWKKLLLRWLVHPVLLPDGKSKKHSDTKRPDFDWRCCALFAGIRGRRGGSSGGPTSQAAKGKGLSRSCCRLFRLKCNRMAWWARPASVHCIWILLLPPLQQFGVSQQSSIYSSNWSFRLCFCDCSAQLLKEKLHSTQAASHWRSSQLLNIYCCGGGWQSVWSLQVGVQGQAIPCQNTCGADGIPPTPHPSPS